MQFNHSYVVSVNNHHTQSLIKRYVQTFSCQVVGSVESEFVVMDLEANQVIYTGAETAHSFGMSDAAESVALLCQSLRSLDASERQRIDIMLSDVVTSGVEVFLYRLFGALSHGVQMGNVKLGVFPLSEDDKHELADRLLDRGFTFAHDAQEYDYYLALRNEKLILPIRLCKSSRTLKAHLLVKHAGLMMERAQYLAGDSAVECDVDFDAELRLINKVLSDW